MLRTTAAYVVVMYVICSSLWLFGAVRSLAEGLPSGVAEEGKRVARLLDKSACGETLTEALQWCVKVEENADGLREAALSIALCYMKSSRRNRVDCEGVLSAEECTEHMTPHEFEIYTYFYSHLPSICLLYHEHHFSSETSRLITALSAALAQALEGLEQMREFHSELSESLYAARKDAEAILQGATEEIERLRSRQKGVLSLTQALHRSTEAVRKSSEYFSSIRDKVLLCLALLTLLFLFNPYPLILYGAMGAFSTLPLSTPVLWLGLGKTLVNYLTKRKGTPRRLVKGHSHTICSDTSKEVH